MADPIVITQRTLLAGLETTYGADPTLSESTHGIVIHKGATVTPVDGQVMERETMKPGWGTNDIIRATEYGSITFRVDVSGSGTAGTPPPYSDLLIACGLAEVIYAATINGTARATESTTTRIQLADIASGDPYMYLGARIDYASGTGQGQYGEVIDYLEATKTCVLAEAVTTPADGTTGYTIGPRVVYRPSSDIAVDGTSLCLYWGEGPVRHVFVGARGSVRFVFEPLKPGYMEFTYTGLLGEISDQAIPAPVNTGWVTPTPFNAAKVGGLYAHGLRSPDIRMSRFSLDQGGDVQYRNIPGYEGVNLVDRKPKSGFTIDSVPIATADFWTPLRAATVGIVSVRVGTVAGNRCMFLLPRNQIMKGAYADDQNFSTFVAECQPLTSFSVSESSKDDEFFFVVR